MTGTDLVTAIALIFVIEGLILAISPETPKRLYELLSAMPAERLRGFGLGSVVFGLAVVWLLRG